MLEFLVFAGLWATVVLILYGAVMALNLSSTNRERDEFNASYEASDQYSQSYQKEYKWQDDPRDNWEKDAKEGFGYDPRFRDP